jgi:hypothetical protein
MNGHSALDLAAGAAILVIAWQPLWWLVNRRRVTWKCPAAVAASLTVLALDNCRPLAIFNTVAWTWGAALRYAKERNKPRTIEVPAGGWSNDPLPRIGHR